MPTALLEELAEEHGSAVEIGAPAMLGGLVVPGEAFRLAADGD